MSNKPPATVYDILQIPPGDRENPSWVNDEFEAVVSNVRPGQGRKPTKADLSDPHNPNVTILASFFGGRNIATLNGKVCLFSGQSMIITEYNGVNEITIGQKAAINVMGGHTGTAREDGGAQRPAAHDDTRGGGGKPPTTASAGHKPINGQTVGMAMKESLALCAQDSVNLNEPAFWRSVHETASDIIRVSLLLESGKLAPSAKDRADPDYAKKQAAKAKEESDRLAAEEAERVRQEEEAKRLNTGGGVQQNLDEDVPF